MHIHLTCREELKCELSWEDLSAPSFFEASFELHCMRMEIIWSEVCALKSPHCKKMYCYLHPLFQSSLDLSLRSCWFYITMVSWNLFYCSPSGDWIFQTQVSSNLDQRSTLQILLTGEYFFRTECGCECMLSWWC